MSPKNPQAVTSGAFPDKSSSLPRTEQRMSPHLDLESLPTLELLQELNDNDTQAVQAVQRVLPEIASLVEVAAQAIRAGGSVHYFGAGTSGRLAVLDAAELLPTFNLDRNVVVAHMAGGDTALRYAVENAEDSFSAGAQEATALGPGDIAIGLTASGNTPYVAGALAQAKKNQTYTALVSCNPQALLSEYAQTHIVLDTGPELLTGSTRLKAGTAEKLMLNGFSTALMVQLGRTWSNLMVSVVATNEKLRQRTVRILMEATGLEHSEAVTVLGDSAGELKTAIVCQLGKVSPQVARDALNMTDHSVRRALEQVHGD